MNFLLATSLFFINEPAIAMREAPSAESRITSQAIFAENIHVEEEQGDWAYVITPDNYKGWIPKDSFVGRDTPYNTTAKISRLAAHVYSVKDTEFGPILTLPFESSIQLLNTSDPRWAEISLPDGKVCYIQKGDIAIYEIPKNKSDLVHFSKQFLGLPYTWGGRTSFGYDCSGFIQMLYRQIGIQLQRDSKNQIKDNRFVTVSVEDVEEGDLVFFGRSPEKIVHVGMAIGNDQFIHTVVTENQPWLRISNLSDKTWNGENPSLPFREIRQLKNES